MSRPPWAQSPIPARTKSRAKPKTPKFSKTCADGRHFKCTAKLVNCSCPCHLRGLK